MSYKYFIYWIPSLYKLCTALLHIPIGVWGIQFNVTYNQKILFFAEIEGNFFLLYGVSFVLGVDKFKISNLAVKVKRESAENWIKFNFRQRMQLGWFPTIEWI